MTIYLRHEGGENLTLLRHNSMTEQLTFCMTQVARDPPTLKILQYLCSLSAWLALAFASLEFASSAGAAHK
jgi:hypothetical protein